MSKIEIGSLSKTKRALTSISHRPATLSLDAETSRAILQALRLSRSHHFLDRARTHPLTPLLLLWPVQRQRVRAPGELQPPAWSHSIQRLGATFFSRLRIEAPSSHPADTTTGTGIGCLSRRLDPPEASEPRSFLDLTSYLPDLTTCIRSASALLVIPAACCCCRCARAFETCFFACRALWSPETSTSRFHSATGSALPANHGRRTPTAREGKLSFK